MNSQALSNISIPIHDNDDNNNNDDDFRDIHALTSPLPVPPNRQRVFDANSRRSSNLSVASDVTNSSENFTTMSREFNALVLAGSTINHSDYNQLGGNENENNRNNINSNNNLDRIGEDEGEVEETNPLAIVPDINPLPSPQDDFGNNIGYRNGSSLSYLMGSSNRTNNSNSNNNNNNNNNNTHSHFLPRPFLSSTSTSFSLSRRRFTIKAADTDTDTDEVKTEVPDKAPSKDGSSFNQLLGIKGASQESNKWKIRLQLTKPVTWPPLVWGVVCGAAASGNFHWTPEDVAKSILCMIMSGPCLTGYTQTLNDWYDREIDAINEPYRPIPSGAISENEVITQIWVLLLGGLGIAGGLDVWAGHKFPILFYLALGGSLVSYIYSAPPLKLKQNGWIGNFALGSSYISLPWWAGQALFGTLTPDIIVLTLLYSIAGLGIAIVNDFKSIEGDRAMGLQSLPVAFGVETAKWICVGAIDITQLSVAGYLLGAGKPYYALALLGLILPQIYFQTQYLLKDPIKYDVKYQASAQPFLILGLLVTALATSH